MTLQDMYRILEHKVTVVYVFPRIPISSIYNPYLSLLYQDFLSGKIPSIRCRSPHPALPAFIIKKLLGEKSIVHFHWLQFLDLKGLFVVLWKMKLLMVYKLLGGKIVWSVHNKHLHSKRYLLFNMVLQKWMARMADMLHVHCAGAAETMAPVLKVPLEKFVVIAHPMYPVTIVERSRAHTWLSSRLLPQLDSTRSIFIMYGNIAHYKGIVEVIPHIDPQKAQMIISGECKKGEQAYLQEIKQACQTRPHIFLIDRFVSIEEEKYLFNAADCVVFNFKEVLSSGSVILALSYRKNIIVPDVSCCKEFNGGNIYKFNSPHELDEHIRSLTLSQK